MGSRVACASMKKVRLLALTTSYPLHPGGSAGVFVQSLYRRLSETYSISVICPSGPKILQTSFEDFTATDIRVHAVRYAPRAWCTLAQQAGGVVLSVKRAPWRMFLLPALLGALFWRSLMLASDADLIHANWTICGAMAGMVGRLRRKPVITTLRGSDVARAEHSWLDRIILDIAVRNSAAVICVSEAMADRARRQFPHRAADIHACLNGVDETFFRIVRTRSDENILRVLAVGNLIRLKGFDVLIDAVVRAHCRDQVRVCIVGDGAEGEVLRALAAAHGVSARFEFPGRLPVSDMPGRFADADVFVLSSYSEGRPNVVVEALASGLPVISTHLEGVRGMVVDGKTGWLVATGDADQLAAALDQASADRAELRRRGERAREVAITQLGTWAATAQAYDACFRKTLASYGRKRAKCAE